MKRLAGGRAGWNGFLFASGLTRVFAPVNPEVKRRSRVEAPSRPGPDSKLQEPKRNLTLRGIGLRQVRKPLILGVGYQPKRNTLQ